MKLKTQEKIRLGELGLGAIISATLMQMGYTDDWIKFLCTTPYYIDVISSLRREIKTDDYIEIKNSYDKVIKNTGDFMRDLGIEDPISVFATYVYMYRHGYLSYDKKYDYSTKMKDFSKIQGVDMVRGLGVCRSAASMHRDICEEMGMNASVLIVDAKDAIPHIEKLCDKDKPIPDKKTKMFVKSVVAFTKALPLANHAITTVEKDGLNYILDPMNDGFLYKGEGNKLLIANDQNYFMKYNMPIGAFNRLIGNLQINKIKDLKEQLKLPSIEYNEYKDIYLEVLNYCIRNKDLFEDFYLTNKDLYNDIVEQSAEHSGIILRMAGLDPVVSSGKKLVKKLDDVSKR